MEETLESENSLFQELVDWFETIEEVELTLQDNLALSEVARTLESTKEGALEMGVAAEDFDEWLRFDVLEHWSNLIEQEDTQASLITSFHQYITSGEQRLYFQMLKRCLTVSDLKTA